MPPLDPYIIGDMHNADEAETLACDLWDARHEDLYSLIAGHLTWLGDHARNCNCPGCVYLYHVMYLGHERIIRLCRKRKELDAELNDDEDSPYER